MLFGLSSIQDAGKPLATATGHSFLFPHSGMNLEEGLSEDAAEVVHRSLCAAERWPPPLHRQ